MKDQSVVDRGPSAADHRMPTAEQCVLRSLLERFSDEQPDKMFAWFESGSEWTYLQARNQANVAGGAFQKLGIRQQEHVLVWLPNGADIVRAWFGLNWIGAVYVPLNLAYRGALLAHAIERSDARVMVVHADLVQHLNSIPLSRLETLIIVKNSGTQKTPENLQCLDAGILEEAVDELVQPERPIQPWDPQSIIYTSGTTGPSKAVLSCYAHLWSSTFEDSFVFLNKDDRFLIGLPLFHAGGTMDMYSSLIRGASVAILDRFRTDQFWSAVRESKSTVTNLVGAMVAFLANSPPQENETDHSLRAFIAIPSNENMKVFARRFRVTAYTAYNMTEISMPIVSGPNPASDGFCGTLRPGVEARIVDENDCELPRGEVGEFVLRTDAPWALNSGYYKDEAATARAWRNGWFHTGDFLRTNEDGEFFFVDRKKDAIRRRGENISSFEVESAATLHPNVKDAVAYAVPSEHGDDDVMLAFTLVGADSLDYEELITVMAGQLAHFMVPRYFRVMKEFPRTPTDKIEKHKLRSEGVTADTWDREAHGVVIKRDALR